MAAIETLERRRELDETGDVLETKLAEEVETILEEAENRELESMSKTGRWRYTMPQAGVRYFSFQRGRDR